MSALTTTTRHAAHARGLIDRSCRVPRVWVALKLLVLLAALLGALGGRVGVSSAAPPAVEFDPPAWARQGVGYLIYVRSFADSDGDGIGDFGGVTAKLGYIQSFGVTVIMLSPPLENMDFADSYAGYAVTDYRNTNAAFGPLLGGPGSGSLQELITAAHGRGMKVMIDMPLNTLGSNHPWFLSAYYLGAASPYYNMFVWADPDASGNCSPTPKRFVGDPTVSMWVKRTIGSMATPKDMCYWAPWGDYTPEWNYAYSGTLDYIEETLLWWVNTMQADGFRIDSVGALADESFTVRAEQSPTTMAAISRFMIAIHNNNTDTYVLGESILWDQGQLNAFYENGIHAMTGYTTFYGIERALDTGSAQDLRNSAQAQYNSQKVDVQLFSDNHDQWFVPGGKARSWDRFATGAATDAERIATQKVIAGLLYSLPGTPFLYYGQELGMATATSCPGCTYLWSRNPMQWVDSTVVPNNGWGAAPGPWAPISYRPDVWAEGAGADKHGLAAMHRGRLSARQAASSLVEGGLQMLPTASPNIVAFYRYYNSWLPWYDPAKGEDYSVVLVNVSTTSATAPNADLCIIGVGQGAVTNRLAPGEVEQQITVGTAAAYHSAPLAPGEVKWLKVTAPTSEGCPRPMLNINDVAGPEGDTGPTNFGFTVSLSAPSTVSVSVDVATASGTASAGTDFVAIPTTTVTFAPGQTTTDVNVPVNGDLLVEPDETFTVTLSNSVNGIIEDATGVGTILNDDIARLSIADVAQFEGNSGTTSLSFPVSLSNPSASSVSVSYATGGGTATSGVDYTAASGLLTFAPLEISQVLNVQVAGDTVIELDETITMSLSGATGGTILDGTATGTILNDDLPRLSISNVQQAEGNSGATPFTFTVSLDAPSPSPASVNYATGGGTATPASDYTAAAGQVTFAAEETVKVITVNVQGDIEQEPDETFNVTLSGATGAQITAAVGIGTITNDDTDVVGGKNFTISASGAVNLTWNSGTLQADYIMVRAQFIPAGATTYLGPLSAGLTSYSDPTVVADRLYCYVLAARDALEAVIGQSDMMCAYTGFASGETDLSPGAFTVGLDQGNTSSLTWTAPPTTPDQYLLYRLPFDGSAINSVVVPAGTNATTHATGGVGHCYILVGQKGALIGSTNLICAVPGQSTLSLAVSANRRSMSTLPAGATGTLERSAAVMMRFSQPPESNVTVP